MHISASILAADTMDLGGAVRAAEAGGAHSIHVDVMDGHYVANLAFGPKVVVDLRRVTNLPVHAHLEVDNPDRCIDLYGAADLIIVQEDTCPDLAATVARIRATGAGAGVAVNPDRPVEPLLPLLERIDLLLVMAVWPGFGGQPFDSSVLTKAGWAWEQRRARGFAYAIGLDGGVGPSTVGPAAHAGVDFFISGTGVFAVDPGMAPAATIAANVVRLQDLATLHRRPG